MSIFNSVRDIISAYGSKIRVHSGEKSISAKAFIQPLRYNGKYYAGGAYRRAGFVSTDRYVYIGSPDVPVISGSTVIETETGKYIVKRSEIYRVGEKAVYIWAVLAPYGNPLEDDYESD